MVGTLEEEYISDILIELNVETTHHHELLLHIRDTATANPNEYQTNRLPFVLGIIAAWCNVEVDSYLKPEELDALAKLLITRLRNMRMESLMVSKKWRY